MSGIFSPRALDKSSGYLNSSISSVSDNTCSAKEATNAIPSGKVFDAIAWPVWVKSEKYTVLLKGCRNLCRLQYCGGQSAFVLEPIFMQITGRVTHLKLIGVARINWPSTCNHVSCDLATKSLNDYFENEYQADSGGSRAIQRSRSGTNGGTDRRGDLQRLFLGPGRTGIPDKASWKYVSRHETCRLPFCRQRRNRPAP